MCFDPVLLNCMLSPSNVIHCVGQTNWYGLTWCLSQQLCAIPETANSDEMQEFLALNTDARIAFVKKPFIVSRIDKVRDHHK